MNARFSAWLITTLIGISPVHSATVRTAPLSGLEVKVEYSAPATVMSYDHSLISAQLDGRVLEVPVRVGDEVTEGQLLVRLDCSDYELSQRQTESSLAALDARMQLARQQLKRAERLLKQRNASEELRDQRSAELNSLRAERIGAAAAVDNAKLRVSRCEIRSPFPGTMTERPAMEGSLASIGTPMVRVLRDRAPEVSASVPSRQLESLLHAKQPALLSDSIRYPLSLRTQLPLMNTATRTREVRLIFTQKPALVGATGRLVWRNQKTQIPAQYAVRRNGHLGVMLWEQGLVRFMPIAGALEGQAVEVGLPPDTQLIVEGQHGVQDGDRVERMESEHANTSAE